jgi:hypothetical protein
LPAQARLRAPRLNERGRGARAHECGASEHRRREAAQVPERTEPAHHTSPNAWRSGLPDAVDEGGHEQPHAPTSQCNAPGHRHRGRGADHDPEPDHEEPEREGEGATAAHFRPHVVVVERGQCARDRAARQDDTNP